MTDEFTEVMKGKQHDRDATISEEVEESNDDCTSNRMFHLGWLLVLLDLLEVKFREHMQVIRQLDDEIELVKEAHWMIRVVCPETRHVLCVLLTNNHFSSP